MYYYYLLLYFNIYIILLHNKITSIKVKNLYITKLQI